MREKPAKRGESLVWKDDATVTAVRDAQRQLARRVVALRTALGLTQEQLAEAAHLHEKHIQRIEGGKANPSLATLVAIARACRVTVPQLLRSGRPAKMTRKSGKRTG